MCGDLCGVIVVCVVVLKEVCVVLLWWRVVVLKEVCVVGVMMDSLRCNSGDMAVQGGV